MKEELLRLFKCYIGDRSNSINQETLKAGVLISDSAPQDVVSLAVDMYGLDGGILNSTFHKSWDKVASASMEELVIEQMIHYFTTYGFENLGIYSESTVYIPAEDLDVPDLEVENIKLIRINAITVEEATERLMTLLSSGVALSKQTVMDVKELSDLIDLERLDEIKNREVRNFFYEKFNIMPKDPESFLRYMIYRLTGSTLKIQSRELIEQLKRSDRALALDLLKSYGNYAKLSSIFLRNKNLFLALKTPDPTTASQKDVNAIVNRLRKLSDKFHRPLKTSMLDQITSLETIDEVALKESLSGIPQFRAIRILNALSYRLADPTSTVYRIRNGKAFVSEIGEITNRDTLCEAYSIIRSHIVEELAKKVKGKFICIPKGIVYKAPTTEKQFMGDIPEGSYLELPQGEDLIFAVNWRNTERSRVDLDLHMMNGANHFGWNSDYRDDESTILFSGDVTSGGGEYGATEAYSVSHKIKNASYLVTLNDFNGTSQGEAVKFKLIVARGKVTSHARREQCDFMIDPNAVVTTVNSRLDKDTGSQITLGTVKATENSKRFYFGNYGGGKMTRIPSQDALTGGILEYANTTAETQVTLNELLLDAGAFVTTSATVEKPRIQEFVDQETGETKVDIGYEESPVDLDLSLEEITKETLINLFS